MSNTPLNADDELRKALYRLIDDVSVETESYIESKGRLIRRPMEARIKPILDLVATDRKKHELQARIDELEVTVFKPMAGKTWLDIRPDVELQRQNNRYNELKQELEKYE